MNANSLRPTLLSVLLICALTTSVVVGGCGSASSRGHFGTYSVSGIVVSYPATLTRAVTLADLTPVGAGVPLAIGEQAGIISTPSVYYQTHALPMTDANGRFTIQVDNAFTNGGDGKIDNPQADITVADRCGTTPTAIKVNGKVVGSSEYLGDSDLTHVPNQQLIDAGNLAQRQFDADVVIVVTDNTGTCEVPVVNLTY